MKRATRKRVTSDYGTSGGRGGSIDVGFRGPPKRNDKAGPDRRPHDSSEWVPDWSSTYCCSSADWRPARPRIFRKFRASATAVLGSASPTSKYSRAPDGSDRFVT